MQLIDLIDTFNQKVRAAARLDYGKYENSIQVTLLYFNEPIGTVFSDFPWGLQEPGFVRDDNDLTKAEAYMNMLLSTAEHCEMMQEE